DPFIPPGCLGLPGFPHQKPSICPRLAFLFSRSNPPRYHELKEKGISFNHSDKKRLMCPNAWQQVRVGPEMDLSWKYWTVSVPFQHLYLFFPDVTCANMDYQSAQMDERS
ncbi:hypothetical protein XENOCAPTIV_017651, partial [Xenoophorus captivus]